jgi:hypothetical protein
LLKTLFFDSLIPAQECAGIDQARQVIDRWREAQTASSPKRVENRWETEFQKSANH